MKKALKLGRRELQIMSVVWRLGEATVREVCAELPGCAYNTILTMMRALEEKKKVLTHRARGKAYAYRATVSRDDVSRGMIADLRDLVFGGSVPSMAHSLLGQQTLTGEDLRRVRSLLREFKSGEES